MRKAMGCMVAALLLGVAHQSSALIFSLDANDLPAAGETVASWGVFNAMGSPQVEMREGMKWLSNTYSPSTGMRHQDSPWDYGNTIAIDGATVVVAAQPRRFAGGDWCLIVDVFYSQLSIGINNQSGRVQVKVASSDADSFRNPTWTAPADTAIADGESGILSMTVTNMGAFTVYWKGEDGIERLIGTGQGDTPDGYTSLYAGQNGAGFTRSINVGRNDPDGWTTYNGLIGSTYVYGTELSEQDRAALVDQTWAAMAIPEPGTIGLLGIAGLIMMIRRARLARK